MDALLRAYDWSKSPLGHPSTWSPSLSFASRLVLANCSPMLLWWGPDFHQIYNDAYIPILGEKHHRAALCRPFRECWSEVFPVLGPLAQSPYLGGPPTWLDDIPLEVNRYGFMEETHFTIGYSAVPDPSVPGGIGGVLATVQEITEKVFAERRVQVLRDLSTRPTEALNVENACQAAASVLAKHEKDIPFSLIYLIEPDGVSARLAASSGVADCPELRVPVQDLASGKSSIWPLAACRDGEEILVVRDLDARFSRLPTGPWSDPPQAAAVIPVQSNVPHQLSGFLVAGISPRRRFDDAYRGFLELLSTQIGTAIARARAREDERKRAEALAEIDQAKTAFFANVSHEFRTPLTLIMSPLADALAEPEQLTIPQHESLRIAHRNCMRLLKLVNTLLDFSRIEAGRMTAAFSPTNLPEFTAELASSFRSAAERARVKLIVNCPPLPETVCIDREMWEKIVLNLLSNAFKHTLQGEIEIAIKQVGGNAVLTVRDTGAGIAEAHLPHVFERFYRAANEGRRSYEGTGIGLSLVQDLVRLNGGKIRLESEQGHGTVATVEVPMGSRHVPQDKLNAEPISHSAHVDSNVFVEEALGWVPGPWPHAAPARMLGAAASTTRPRILLAEDNADMRDYLERLLAATFDIKCVADGVDALHLATNSSFDLVLTDVMMPRLDGFGLLKALRGNPKTSSLPVILLSARAGEEARVEGISAGADDYLVKPFSAREIVARVENQLNLARLRRETDLRIRESEERLRAFVSASSDVVYRMSPDWSVLRQLSGREFIADTEVPRENWLDQYILPDDQPLVTEAIQRAIRTKSMFELEHRVLRPDGTHGWTFSRAVPLLNTQGEIVEWFGTATDVTSRKYAEQAIMQSEKYASVGRMAATIAHEINNPLESLTNLLFLADHADDLPQQVHSILSMADVELQRVALITRQTLGFYKESNLPVKTRLSALLDSSTQMLKAKIHEKQARVEKDCPDDIEIDAVPGELRQVFSNLLVNSLDAIEQRGEILIRVSLASLKTRRAGAVDAQAVRITFCDSGRGISPEIRQRIFEPFFTTKGSSGTGIGLWISKQIVEKHGGTIAVRSRGVGAASGTVFSIHLPIRAS